MRGFDLEEVMTLQPSESSIVLRFTCWEYLERLLGGIVLCWWELRKNLETLVEGLDRKIVVRYLFFDLNTEIM